MTDVSSLLPPDAVVALRSFPRRYATTVGARNHEDGGNLAEVKGPDGRSALDLLVETTAAIATATRDLRQILAGGTPTLGDATGVVAGRDLEAELQALDEAAHALADAVEHVPGNDWELTATSADGETVTALDVVREAVGVAAGNLRAAERTIGAAREG